MRGRGDIRKCGVLKEARSHAQPGDIGRGFGDARGTEGCEDAPGYGGI